MHQSCALGHQGCWKEHKKLYSPPWQSVEPLLCFSVVMVMGDNHEDGLEFGSETGWIIKSVPGMLPSLELEYSLLVPWNSEVQLKWSIVYVYSQASLDFPFCLSLLLFFRSFFLSAIIALSSSSFWHCWTRHCSFSTSKASYASQLQDLQGHPPSRSSK